MKHANIKKLLQEAVLSDRNKFSYFFRRALLRF